jgi:hypothetical protein
MSDNDDMRHSEEGPAYTKEQIEERMRKTYGSSSSSSSTPTPSVKTKRPFASRTRAAFRKGADSVGGYLKKKVKESRDVDIQIKKTNKKAELAEAKNRLSKAQSKSRKYAGNGGGSFGGSFLNDPLFEEPSPRGQKSQKKKTVSTPLDFGLNLDFGLGPTKKGKRKDPFDIDLDFGI